MGVRGIFKSLLGSMTALSHTILKFMRQVACAVFDAASRLTAQFLAALAQVLGGPPQLLTRPISGLGNLLADLAYLSGCRLVRVFRRFFDGSNRAGFGRWFVGFEAVVRTIVILRWNRNPSLRAFC
jgi:hypothetical protein